MSDTAVCNVTFINKYTVKRWERCRNRVSHEQWIEVGLKTAVDKGALGPTRF